MARCLAAVGKEYGCSAFVEAHDHSLLPGASIYDGVLSRGRSNGMDRGISD